MEDEDRIRVVQRLWDAFARGGVEELRPLVDEDTVWQPFSARGRVLRGPDELAAFFTELFDEHGRIEVHPYGYETQGDCVVVSANLRRFERHGFADSQVHYVFSLDGLTVRSARSFGSRSEALEHVARACT